jgi:phage terminase large subunit-like protein
MAYDDAVVEELAYLKAEWERLLPFAGTEKWFGAGPYSIDNCPKHKEFFAAGAKYRERLFMAANRAGKSVAGAYETACHLTGNYPDWWEGKRFDKPTLVWACGKTGTTTRDTVQKELLGPLGSLGTGMIPADSIIRTYAKPGIPNGIDTVLVKHKSGGTSVCTFKSYDQEVRGFQGTAQHVIWLDEECPDDIYGECMIRTMTTKGIIYDTFTPQSGLTNFILTYHKTADLLAGARSITAEEADERAKDAVPRYRCVIQAGWDDAPWLDADEKERMLQKVEPHLRDARSKGIPNIGEGNVYPLTWDEVQCESFEIPAHWKRIYGMDVGWNYTAAVFLAIDPETDAAYVYAAYKGEKKRPEEHAARIKDLAKGWIPGTIDPASRGRSQTDGSQLLSIYRQHGLRLHLADNAVESGVQTVWDRLSNGKLKIFKHLHGLREEYMIYRRENGRIVKEHDHLLDALRYAVMEINRARAQHMLSPLDTQGEGGGKRYF